MTDDTVTGPLHGLRVLDLGTMVAAPVTATLLADFGAEVLKIEQPGMGDTLRHVGPFCEGESLYWNVEGRNKKSVTINLRMPEGQTLLKKLVADADAVVENFRPGTLAKWCLSYADLKEVNPKLVMLSISGYGQTGPYAPRAGYDRIGLAFGGLLHMTGFPDRAPLRPGTAMADYQSGIFGAYSLMMALYHRDAMNGPGQHIDLSLYEATFRFTDVMITAWDKLGIKRERMGNVHFAAAPGDHFPTSDGRFIVLTVSNDNMYKRMCDTIGRPDLVDDPRFKTHGDRATNVEAINRIVGDWILDNTVDDVIAALEQRGLAYSLVYSVEEISDDPHYAARETIASVENPRIGALKMPAAVPKLSATPAPDIRSAPDLGEHTEAILRDLLQVDGAEYARLKDAGVV